MPKIAVALGFILSIGIPLTAQQAQYQKNGDALLPDDQMTPGVVAITDTHKICTTKWGTDERFVTAAMKKQVYALYGTAVGKGICKPTSHTGANGKTVKRGCEIDHRVSREVGGADDVKNLWPQPYLSPSKPGAYEKDKLENWLHKQVCAVPQKMTLEQAQQTLMGDWYAAYLKIFAD